MSHRGNDPLLQWAQDMLNGFTEDEILGAIESLGIESLCGVSEVEPHEVWEFLGMMEQHEIGEIAELCQHRYNKAKEMVEDGLS